MSLSPPNQPGSKPGPMQSSPRILLSACGGVLLTVLMFWLMQWMITRQTPDLRVDSKAPVMEFVRLIHDSHLTLKQRVTPEPPPPQPPPPRVPDISVRNPLTAAMTPHIAVPAPSPAFNMSQPLIGPVLSGVMDRDITVLSRTPPQYPFSAARRKIEGWVKLSMLITATGAVKDVVVLDSSPPRVFDQAAIRAVYSWKFKPRIQDGKPVASRAEQTLEFTLKK